MLSKSSHRPHTEEAPTEDDELSKSEAKVSPKTVLKLLESWWRRSIRFNYKRLLKHQVSWIESHTKLYNRAHISASTILHSLTEQWTELLIRSEILNRDHINAHVNERVDSPVQVESVPGLPERQDLSRNSLINLDDGNASLLKIQTKLFHYKLPCESCQVLQSGIPIFFKPRCFDDIDPDPSTKLI